MELGVAWSSGSFTARIDICKSQRNWGDDGAGAHVACTGRDAAT